VISQKIATLSPVLGVLSLASGTAMIAAPRAMAKLYALPQEPAALSRWLGARDVVIGACLLRPQLRRLGGLARCVGDFVDFSLMLHEARHARGGVKRVRGRLATALLSAAAGLIVTAGKYEP
jgi:hypothetical protein